MVHTSDFHLFPIIIMLSLFIFKECFTGKYQSFKESCEVKKNEHFEYENQFKNNSNGYLKLSTLTTISSLDIGYCHFFLKKIKLYIVHKAGIVYFTLFHLKTVPL